jgi:hypothetical protein
MVQPKCVAHPANTAMVFVSSENHTQANETEVVCANSVHQRRLTNPSQYNETQHKSKQKQ